MKKNLNFSYINILQTCNLNIPSALFELLYKLYSTGDSTLHNTNHIREMYYCRCYQLINEDQIMIMQRLMTDQLWIHRYPSQCFIVNPSKLDADDLLDLYDEYCIRRDEHLKILASCLMSPQAIIDAIEQLICPKVTFEQWRTYPKTQPFAFEYSDEIRDQLAKYNISWINLNTGDQCDDE